MTDEYLEAQIPDETPPRRPPSIWPPFLAYLIAIVLTIVLSVVIGIVLAVIYLLGGGNQQQLDAELTELITTPTVFVIITLGTQVIFLVTAAAFAYFAPVRPQGGLGFKFVRSVVPAWGYPVLAVGSLVPYALGMLAALAVSLCFTPDDTIERVFGKLLPLGAVPFVLFIAFVPGFVEEAFFRGYIQRRLLSRWPAWAAITATSVLFGLVHFDPVTVAFAFVVGLWLGAVAYRSGSIWPAALCHASINASSSCLHLGTRFGIIPDPPPLIAIVLGIVLSLVGFAGSIWLLSRPPTVRLAEEDLR